MDDHESLPLLGVGNGSDHRQQFPIDHAEFSIDRLLNREMWHHLAADLGKPALAARNRDESLAIQPSDVAGAVPAVADHSCGEIGPVEIALHDIGTSDPQHPLLSDRKFTQSFPIGDLRAGAWNGLPHGSLPAVGRPTRHMARGGHIDSHQRGKFCGAIGLAGTRAKFGLKGVADFCGQFLCRPKHRLQGGEVLGRRPANIRAQERRRGHQQRGMVLPGQLADRLSVEWIGVVDDRGLQNQRRPERGGVAVGVEERQHPQGNIGGGGMEQLIDCPQVGGHILL